MTNCQDNQNQQSVSSSMAQDIERMLATPDQIIVPDDLHVFAGHFPGNPIVPAVYTLELALRCAQSKTGTQGTLRRIDRAKFNRPVVPGMQINAKVDVRLESPSGLYQVKVVFREHLEGQIIASLQFIIDA